MVSDCWDEGGPLGFSLEHPGKQHFFLWVTSSHYCRIWQFSFLRLLSFGDSAKENYLIWKVANGCKLYCSERYFFLRVLRSMLSVLSCAHKQERERPSRWHHGFDSMCPHLSLDHISVTLFQVHLSKIQVRTSRNHMWAQTRHFLTFPKVRNILAQFWRISLKFWQ